MSESTIDLTAKDFDSKTKKGRWIIDCWAEWCGPCRILEPIFDSVAKEMHGKINFGKVDVDKETSLAERFEIMSIPLILFMKDGEVVDQVHGVISKEELIKMAKGI